MCKYINITYEYVLCMYVCMYICMYVCFLFIQTIPLSDGVFGYPNKTKQNRTFKTPIFK